jgi:Ca-activated chloride channel family protein
MDLLYDSVEVTIHDQIVQVKTKQYYHNYYELSQDFRFGFPLNEGASPVDLRWRIDSTWYEADFSPQAQDSIMPGEENGYENIFLNQFMGPNPFYFTFANPLEADGYILIELTYVFMMPYHLGLSEFIYPLNHNAIGGENMDLFMSVNVQSQRIIDEYTSSLDGTNPLQSDYQVYFELEENLELVEDYVLSIEFNADDLGIFSYSTFTSVFEEVGCDTLGRGFLGLIIEPGSNSDIEIIPKIFSLVIDRSGSMDGTKIQQAKEAASFIVNNLNPIDYFNIVDFSSDVHSLFSDHVANTAANRTIALNFISNITAGGGTNISDALSAGIQQYNGASEEAAHIMIFFTDGQASGSINSTEGILELVSDTKSLYAPELTIFSFGIGDYVNEQLLNLLALQNNGLYTNVANNLVSEVISEFYLLIQNPVMLNTQISFDPPVVYEVYPHPLQNLYIGQQLRIFGRYYYADTVQITLSGNAFGEPVSYTYEVVLNGIENPEYNFVSKMWADQKIKNLQNEFYASFDAQEQEAIEEDIIGVSLCYGVISDFTSFQDNTGSTFIEETTIEDNVNIVFPIPFENELRIDLSSFTRGEIVVIEFYDASGRIMHSMTVVVGTELLILNDDWLTELQPGTYVCRIIGNNKVISQKAICGK